MKRASVGRAVFIITDKSRDFVVTKSGTDKYLDHFAELKTRQITTYTTKAIANSVIERTGLFYNYGRVCEHNGVEMRNAYSVKECLVVEEVLMRMEFLE